MRLHVLGVNLNEGDYDLRTPLHLAACSGSFNIVKFLVQKRVEINPRDRWGATPLNDAKTEEIRDFLVENGALKFKENIDYSAPHNSVVTEDQYRLFYSAYHNNLQLIKSLHISYDLNVSDYDMRTALGIAASEGHLQIVQYLVRHGANIRHRDARGNDALEDAKRENRTEVADFLEKALQ